MMQLSVYVEEQSRGGKPAIKFTLSVLLGDEYILEEEWITKEMLEAVLKGSTNEVRSKE